jgi:hypothetical protein
VKAVNKEDRTENKGDGTGERTVKQANERNNENAVNLKFTQERQRRIRA